MRFFLNIALLPICAVVVLAAPAPSSVSINLAWEPSASMDVSGYRIYYGVGGTVAGWNGTNTTCGCYTNSFVLGNVTNVTINSIARGENYYFAATAIGTNGLESDYSNEVIFKAPKKPTPPKNLVGQ